MAIVIAAITAKAANRLILTPHRSRKKPKIPPRPNRNAMRLSPPPLQDMRRQYRDTRLTKSADLWRSAAFFDPKKQKGRHFAGLSMEVVPAKADQYRETTGPLQLKR
jgi:hypothetical protein